MSQQWQGYQQPPPQFNAPPQFQNPQFASSQFINTQPTGIPLQAQPTGFPGQFGGPRPPPSFLSQPPPPPPPIPSRFGGPGGGGLVPQPTGFPGGAGIRPLVAQPTGFIDPRLQFMSSSFLPANTSAPYSNASGGLQFNAPQLGGVSSFQSSLQAQNIAPPPTAPGGGTGKPIGWALTKAEKKQYDQIFRVWDTSNTGFLDGSTAQQVFGQSGLERGDLAKIWSLADGDNRGKLNIAEFHVAMGLIYRKLSGLPIPNQLPTELIPPSSQGLGDSVNFVKDLLREPARIDPNTQASRASARSFLGSESGSSSRKDGTLYTYDEERNRIYQPATRKFDRRTVRTGNESPSDELGEIKRQLRGMDEDFSTATRRTKEDDELDDEMDDLRYRIKRLKEDMERIDRRGGRGREEERRKLERELLTLQHERIPEVERKMEEREERRQRAKREEAKDRDRRNERSGRYDDRDRGRDYDRDRGRYSPRDDSRERERERGYLRGTYDRSPPRDDYRRDRDYDRDRDRDRDYYRDRDLPRDRDRDYHDRERDRDRDRDRDSGRRSPPTSTRSPPPPAPAPAPPVAAPAPKPSASPAVNTKNMTAEERAAYIRERAQQQIMDRMAKLGLSAPSPVGGAPGVDKSVEERLAKEKAEAEELSRKQEAERAQREKDRLERLVARGVKVDPPPPPVSGPAPPTPTSPQASIKKAPPAPPVRKSALKKPSPAPPPAPPVQQPVPPPPRVPVAPPPPAEDPEEIALRAREEAMRQRALRLRELEKQEEIAARAPPPPPQPDPEEEAMKAREEAMRKRNERLRQLEKEEEEARKAEEEFERRRLNRAKSPAPTSIPVPPPAPPVVEAAPPPPPPVPVIQDPGPPAAPSTNPFNRLKMGNGNGAPAPTAVASPPTATSAATNPFFRPQSAAPGISGPPPVDPIVPPVPFIPPARPASNPPPGRGHINLAPASDDEDDWAKEKEQDSDSDDEFAGSRNLRETLAQHIFGGGAGASPTPPPAPPPAPAQPTMANGAPPSAPVAPPPPAPPAPGPPKVAAVSAPAPSAGAGNRSALLGQIQGGLRLRKTVTNDRSQASVSGSVIGDSAPPAHINLATTTEAAANVPKGHGASPSVDWMAGRAADGGSTNTFSALPPMREEPEPEPEPEPMPPANQFLAVPDIQVHEPSGPSDDIDMTKSIAVFSLYAYEGSRPEDLSFAENTMLTAHPSKSGGDWWYGTINQGGKSGYFPNTYVKELQNLKAKALYSYAGGNPFELPFVEGDHLAIVDNSDENWWRTEQDGVIFVVPATYLELVDG